jgi:hypothetical protein
MSLAKEGRKVRSQVGRTFPPVVRFADAIAAALHRQYGDSYGSIKNVRHATGVGEKTAKNWFQAKNGPSGESLVRLCQHSDEVFETVLQLSGRHQPLRIKKLAEITIRVEQMLQLLREIDRLQT